MVRGDLTIKDRTREIILEVRPLGFGPGNRGAMLSGWEASFSIDRTDFGSARRKKPSRRGRPGGQHRGQAAEARGQTP